MFLSLSEYIGEYVLLLLTNQQEELERERFNLLSRATMAEAQVEQMQEYMNRTIADYQKVISDVI